MSYTILSAKYSNHDGTAILAMTAESGSILVTQSPGKKEKWDALQAWVAAGGVIAPFSTQASEKQRDPLAELDKLKSTLIAKTVISESDLSEAKA
jgi:hypothetical protein